MTDIPLVVVLFLLGRWLLLLSMSVSRWVLLSAGMQCVRCACTAACMRRGPPQACLSKQVGLLYTHVHKSEAACIAALCTANLTLDNMNQKFLMTILP